MPARLALLALLVVCAGAARRVSALGQYPDGVKVVTRVEYYEVFGGTSAELAADLQRRGPRDDVGRVRTGMAQSPLRSTYITVARGPDCTAIEAEVTVYTHITLPKWVPPADTEPGLSALWNKSVTALEVHEAGHQEISVRFAKRMRDGIAALRAPCRAFAARVDSANAALMTEMRSEQTRYDAETLHGLTQGTGFPPRRAP